MARFAALRRPLLSRGKTSRRAFSRLALLAGLGGLAVGPAQAWDSAWSGVIQPDGKIVVGGGTSLGSNSLPKSYFALARYRPNGSLDTRFGRRGKVATALGAHLGGHIHAQVFVVALGSDGKIVAAGDSYNGHNFDFALARYNPDGSLDPGFGSGGKVLTDFRVSDRALGVVLQHDGKIVAAGSGGGDYIHEGGHEFLALARYKPDGSLDPGFGTGGKVTDADFGVGGFVLGLALQPDGKIVAAGGSLARYDSDGALDQSFGTGGKVATPNFEADAIALEPDGRMVAAGRSSNGSDCDFAVARYEPDGSLDQSFGTDGKVTTEIGPGCEVAHAAAVQPDGKIVVAGRSRNASGDSDVALARYNSDGSLDTSFGSRGKVITTDLADALAVGVAVALQADAKIVVTTGVNDTGALARFNRDGSRDASFGSGGKVTTSFAVCQVPELRGKKLGGARRAIINARCSVGKVTNAFSRKVERGRVMSQKPSAATWRAIGAKVELVVSRGKRNPR